MKRFERPFYSRGAKGGVVAVALLTGFLVTALVAVAATRSPALQIAKNAKVTNQAGTTARENIVVTRRGSAVYTLSGDSKRHPKCTKANHCFTVWVPVSSSAGKKARRAAGIKGKLAVWRRDGFSQLTLAGHPLYRFVADSHRNRATGEGIKSFGGTWHVIKTRGPATNPPTPPTTTTTSTTTTTTSSACPYCY